MKWSEEQDRLLHVRPVDANSARVQEPSSSYGASMPYNIVERTRQFALEIVSFSQVVRQAGWHSLSDQLFRSGTSVGTNMSEAQQAESRKGLIHKVRLAAKEASGTRSWLSLCHDSPHLPYTVGMYEKVEALNALLATIIAQAIHNDPKRKEP